MLGFYSKHWGFLSLPHCIPCLEPITNKFFWDLVVPGVSDNAIDKLLLEIVLEIKIKFLWTKTLSSSQVPQSPSEQWSLGWSWPTYILKLSLTWATGTSWYSKCLPFDNRQAFILVGNSWANVPSDGTDICKQLYNNAQKTLSNTSASQPILGSSTNSSPLFQLSPSKGEGFWSNSTWSQLLWTTSRYWGGDEVAQPDHWLSPINNAWRRVLKEETMSLMVEIGFCQVCHFGEVWLLCVQKDQ